MKVKVLDLEKFLIGWEKARQDSINAAYSEVLDFLIGTPQQIS
jgi:hypothetical protein